MHQLMDLFALPEMTLFASIIQVILTVFYPVQNIIICIIYCYTVSFDRYRLINVDHLYRNCAHFYNCISSGSEYKFYDYLILHPTHVVDAARVSVRKNSAPKFFTEEKFQPYQITDYKPMIIIYIIIIIFI